MKTPTVILTDPALLESYHKNTTGRTEDAGEVFFNDEDGFAREVLPEEIMTKLEEFTGNGEGRVTVSADLAMNDYGRKAGAFFSVSVNCDSSMEALQGVHDALAPFVQATVEEDCVKMQERLTGLYENKSTGPIAPKTRAQAVDAAPTKVPAKVTAKTQAAVRR